MATGGGYKFRVYEICSHDYEVLATSAGKVETAANSGQSYDFNEACRENGEIEGRIGNSDR